MKNALAIASRQTLSVAIVAKNEEENLKRILPTIAGMADEIILIDSGSTDRTLEVARSYDAITFTEPWHGYGAQVNHALRRCTKQWIFSLDADEGFTPELAQEIRELLASTPPYPAYFIPRRNYFLGRAILHGGFYPDRKLRLFRRGTAWAPEDSEPHATPKFGGLTGALHSDLLHFAYPSLTLYLEHMNRYSSDSVPLVLKRGRIGRSLPAFLWHTLMNPLATFAYNYGLRGGFLDGREGFLLHLYHSCYISWKYAKAWEQARHRIPGEPQRFG